MATPILDTWRRKNQPECAFNYRPPNTYGSQDRNYLGMVKDPWGNEKAGFATEITLNRKDYGINWNAALDNGGVVLSDDVKVSINLETQKQKKDAAKGK